MEYLRLLDSNLQFGMIRRQHIKKWFDEHPDGVIPINRKYQVQLKYDPDLQKLIKSGFLKRKRQIYATTKNNMGWKKCGANQTYLVKA